MAGRDKPIVWIGTEIKSPPLSAAARIDAGVLLRRIQRGELLGMPHSRPMPAIGARVHELRINDRSVTWRVLYRIDSDAVVIGDVFAKKSGTTPTAVISRCQSRFRGYDRATTEQ